MAWGRGLLLKRAKVRSQTIRCFLDTQKLARKAESLALPQTYLIEFRLLNKSPT